MYSNNNFYYDGPLNEYGTYIQIYLSTWSILNQLNILMRDWPVHPISVSIGQKISTIINIIDEEIVLMDCWKIDL